MQTIVKYEYQSATGVNTVSETRTCINPQRQIPANFTQVSKRALEIHCRIKLHTVYFDRSKSSCAAQCVGQRFVARRIIQVHYVKETSDWTTGLPYVMNRVRIYFRAEDKGW
jgi:hypothetical protein